MALERAHAILRVRYRGDSKGQVHYFEVESEQRMLDKIGELQQNSEVQQVGVFLCHHYEDRTEYWKKELYVAAATGGQNPPEAST